MLIDKSHQASFLTYDIHSHYRELILIIINMTLTYSFPQIHRWLFFQPVSFYLFGFSRKRNIHPLLRLVIWIHVYYGLWSGYISWLIVRQGEGTMVFIADKISKLQCSKLLRLQMFDKLSLSIKIMTLIFLKARSKWPNFRIFKWQKSILYNVTHKCMKWKRFIK